MFYRRILLSIYKIFSKFYVFLFGSKKMQLINEVIFSLALDAKGYKNYGNFSKTGEKFFINLIKNEINLAIDIGANIGSYTKLLLSESNAKVISFEPLPEAFKELETLKNEFKNRLTTHNLALGNDNKMQDLFYENSKSEKASLIENLEELSFIKDKNKNKTSIKVCKLDDFEKELGKEIIDFIKIDTEGYEYEVLLGAKNILMKHKPKFIQIEFNWHQLIKNQTLYNLSKLISFSDVFRILPNKRGLIHVDPSRPENNIYHLSNYIFIRKDISQNYK